MQNRPLLDRKTEAREEQSLLNSIKIKGAVFIHPWNTKSIVTMHLSEYALKVIICPGLSLNGLCMT